MLVVEVEESAFVGEDVVAIRLANRLVDIVDRFEVVDDLAVGESKVSTTCRTDEFDRQKGRHQKCQNPDSNLSGKHV